jgi:hypothetical protein
MEHLTPVSLAAASFDRTGTASVHGSDTVSAVPARKSILARLTSASLLVSLMAVVGIIDLVCTITAYETGVLDEMNPLALVVLEHYGSPGLAVFRFVATSLSAILLVWALRAYRARYELDSAAWRVRLVMHAAGAVIVGAHVGLVCWWAAWMTI